MSLGQIVGLQAQGTPGDGHWRMRSACVSATGTRSVKVSRKKVKISHESSLTLNAIEKLEKARKGISKVYQLQHRDSLQICRVLRF